MSLDKAIEHGKERQKNRSKTFHGIARAMAEQWGVTFCSLSALR